MEVLEGNGELTKPARAIPRAGFPHVGRDGLGTPTSSENRCTRGGRGRRSLL